MMGKRSRVQKGMSITQPPFFLDRVDNKLYPNENKEVLRYIYERIKRGVSLREVERELNNSKFKPPTDKVCGRTAISNALKSPFAWGGSGLW